MPHFERFEIHAVGATQIDLDHRPLRPLTLRERRDAQVVQK
ncbi:hypothetical protein [Sphingomonas gei]|nr:hypothetical protein [Sphingomonas gei]